MLTRTITYEDYDGNMRTEDFFFNLSQAEVIKWLTTSGDYTLDKVLEKLQKERNGREIMRRFEELIEMSYGEKSLDGKRFIKSKEVKEAFLQTEAYSVLFTEIVTDASKAAEFINGIIPKKMAEEIQKIMDENPEGIPAEIKDYLLKK